MSGSITISSGMTTLSMPDNATGTTSALVAVPIIANPSDGYLGVDLVVQWNSAILTGQSVTVAPGLPADWQVNTNLSTPGVALISLFGTTPLTTTQPIAYIHFLVTGALGDQSPAGPCDRHGQRRRHPLVP